MSKQIIIGQEARQKLASGVHQLAEAVGATLGPLGSNVALDKKWTSPLVVHDGVTVAKDIELGDPFENMGAQMVKEASSKANDIAGDGTTTATVLADAIVQAGLPLIDAGANPMRLQQGIRLATKELLGAIQSAASPITTIEEARQIATISAQRVDLGEIVADAVWKVGKDGVVTVEEGQGREITVNHREGLRFERGYLSPYFVTDTDSQTVELDNAIVLVTNHPITTQGEMIALVEKVIEKGQPIVVIAEEVSQLALGVLVMNHLKRTFQAVAVGAPAFGDRRQAIMEDIAVLTGATFVDKTLTPLSQVTAEMWGTVDKLMASAEETTLVVKDAEERIAGRVKTIRGLLEKATAEFEKEKLQERLAKLSGGVAVISVGASTELEMKETKERAIDAVAATKAAIDSGIIPGGASTLLRAAESITLTDPNEDVLKGIALFKQACHRPLAVLTENAGLSYFECYSKLMEGKAPMGIDIMDGQEKDLIEAGIVDPCKVLLSAVEHASSVAGMILTTKVLVVDKPEKDSSKESTL